MTTYVLVDNTVHNPEPYREYLAVITPTVAKYNGRYVIRAGEVHYCDSDWNPERLVLIAFDTPEEAKKWVCSDEMKQIHALRNEHATSKLIIIEGVADATSGQN